MVELEIEKEKRAMVEKSRRKEMGGWSRRPESKTKLGDKFPDIKEDIRWKLWVVSAFFSLFLLSLIEENRIWIYVRLFFIQLWCFLEFVQILKVKHRWETCAVMTHVSSYYITSAMRSLCSQPAIQGKSITAQFPECIQFSDSKNNTYHELCEDTKERMVRRGEEVPTWEQSSITSSTTDVLDFIHTRPAAQRHVAQSGASLSLWHKHYCETQKYHQRRDCSVSGFHHGVQ